MINYSYFLVTGSQFTALHRWLDRLFGKNTASKKNPGIIAASSTCDETRFREGWQGTTLCESLGTASG
jgi:hypothetical protein